MSAALARYAAALRALPPSGGGGCHAALLGIANRGLAAGLTPEQIGRDLRAAVHGNRPVPDAEILAAIRRAEQDAPTRTGPRPRWTPRPTPTAPAFDGEAARRAYIARGAGVTEVEIWECSPVRVDWPPEDDAARMLATLYAPEDVLFIGAAEGQHAAGRAHVRTVADWMGRADTLTRWPHIIPNPLTGTPAPKKDGTGRTYRGDSCVAAHRYAVIEFDALPRAQQIEFFAGVPWPIEALIDSGGKSVHAWLKVDMPDAAAWEANVRPLYRERFACMGIDKACANPARLSRLPGHQREGGRTQRILFLDPKARGPRHYLIGE